MGDHDEVRKRLIELASNPRTRSARFSPERPVKWNPDHVFDPTGSGRCFTPAGAWDYIVALLQAGEPIEEIKLIKPPDAVGYVLKKRIGPDGRILYIKLQLGPKQVFGRSFHYSIYE